MEIKYAYLASMMLAAGIGWLAAVAVNAPAVSKEPRFPQLTMEQLNDQQRPLGEQIMKVSSVGLAGPYNPMLRSPVFGQKMFDLLYYLRWQTSVPLRLNEFAILIKTEHQAVGTLWSPVYVDHRHVVSIKLFRTDQVLDSEHEVLTMGLNYEIISEWFFD